MFWEYFVHLGNLGQINHEDFCIHTSLHQIHKDVYII